MFKAATQRTYGRKCVQLTIGYMDSSGPASLLPSTPPESSLEPSSGDLLLHHFQGGPPRMQKPLKMPIPNPQGAGNTAPVHYNTGSHIRMWHVLQIPSIPKWEWYTYRWLKWFFSSMRFKHHTSRHWIAVSPVTPALTCNSIWWRRLKQFGRRRSWCTVETPATHAIVCESLG